MQVQEARHGRLRVEMSGADLLAPEDPGTLEGLHVSGYAGESVGLVMEPKGRDSKWGHGLTSSSCTRLTADLGQLDLFAKQLLEPFSTQSLGERARESVSSANRFSGRVLESGEVPDHRGLGAQRIVSREGRDQRLELINGLLANAGEGGSELSALVRHFSQAAGDG
jgi:hypothetical protein